MTTILDRPDQDAARALLSQTIMAQFRSGLRELRCMGGDRMRRTEISFTNMHILSMLDRHGDMPMSRLAEKLDVSLSNASGLVDRLEDRGFVERVRVPDDRRVVLVRATDLGRTALTRAEVMKDELVQQVLNRLDDRRLRRLALALDDVREAAFATFAADPELSRHNDLEGHDHQPPTTPTLQPATVPASPPDRQS
jgi:DNA-binding MarR family transcriptional regulator